MRKTVFIWYHCADGFVFVFKKVLEFTWSCCPAVLVRLLLQVSQSELVGLCRTIQSPRSFKSLTRYILGYDRCSKSENLVDKVNIEAAFQKAEDLQRKTRAFHERLEPWFDQEAGERLFKWNGAPNV